MSASFKPLIQGTYVPNAAADMYTVPSGQRARIDLFTVTNQTGSAATLTVWIVPKGASVANNHRLMVTRSIPGDGKPYAIPEMKHTLNAGDVIRAVAGTANALSIFVSGPVFS